MYKLILFDFDGTIADTSEGILDSHRYALKAMEHDIPAEEELRKLIGGNLLKIYTEAFGFSEEKACGAIKIYRKRYAEIGIHKACLYPGFNDLLIKLKEKGLFIGVATLKAEVFAKQMLFEMGIADYFDIICGMDRDDTLDKAAIIQKCMNRCYCDVDETLFVGDSENDVIGACKAGVRFIGVTYGFGFVQNKKYDFETKNSVIDLLNYIVNYIAK